MGLADIDALIRHPALSLGPGRIAGIGTRRLDRHERERIEDIACAIADVGHTIVSGAAEGADLSWMRGALRAGGRVDAFLPWEGFQRAECDPAWRTVVFDPSRHTEWITLAEAAHPAWRARRRDKRPVLSRGMRCLLARNAGILVGERPGDRVSLVLAWPAPDRRGGTEHALRIAGALELPVVLLGPAGLQIRT